MKLSIIIPVYNVEAYVGTTLLSIFDTVASTDDFEVIVVNDGTEDGAMRVVREFSDRSNLTIIEQDHQGLSAARNHGLDLARGEYVWFVDSDDYLVKDGVGKVLSLLQERSGVEVLMFPLLRRDSRHPAQDKLDYQIDHDFILSGKEAIRARILSSFGWVMRFVILRSMLATNYWLRFPMGLLHEDLYFGAALMYSAHRVSILAEPIYVYRVFRSGSIMSSSTVERVNGRLEVYRRLMVFMKINVDPEDRSWFQSFCFNNIVYCYDVSLFGQKDYRSFILGNGAYLYRQWLEIHPQASLFKRMKRHLFYTNPFLHRAINKPLTLMSRTR